MTEITVYSLAVRITSKDARLIDNIERFIKKYYLSKGLSVSVNAPSTDKEFVSRIAGGEYVMHTNQFVHMLHHFKEVGESIGETVRHEETEYQVVQHDYQVRPSWQLRDYQKEIYDFILDNPVKSKMVSLQTGKGKAQSLNAKIRVPGGWKRMGDMQVGDTVTAADGTPCKVTGVYPQGNIPVFRAMFEDGRHTEVCADHLWKIQCECNETSSEWYVTSTQEIQKLLEESDLQVYIPIIQPELGVYLNPPAGAYECGEHLALTDCESTTIPRQYFETSVQCKRLLLEGLLQYTARFYYTGEIHYWTRSPQMALDIQYLVRSMGGVCAIDIDAKEGYVVAIEGCGLNKFAETGTRLKLVSIVPVGVKAAQCIAIDHPEHLYVTDDFIVTHNTVIALSALAAIKNRIGICILPTYIEKWVMDIVNIHEAKTNDIMVISGAKAIRSVLAMARDNELNAKYFIFSSRTMQDYISAYEENPQHCVMTYGCAPFQFFQELGIGSLLVDETHQHFHAIFKIILYSNVKFQLGLSATLISDDSVVSRVHRIVYTPKQTYEMHEMDRYIDVYALAYYIPQEMIRSIRTTNYGMNHYSHTAFEGSMMKTRTHLNFYVRLITANIEALYLDRYEKNDKCLVFVGTVKLATLLAKTYQTLLPHLKVNRYCEDDPVENLYESDLIISTVISSGTAVDIKDLRVVLQTVSISSAPQNIQNLGRLRKLDEGRDVRFGYLFAENITKQVQYHHRREELFSDRALSHRTFKAKTVPSPALTQTS